MIALPWWAWLGLGVVGILGLSAAARRAWRTGIRRELIDYLAGTAPEFVVVAAHRDRLELRPAAGTAETGTLHLHRVYEQAAAAPRGEGPDARAAREAIYAAVVAMLRESAANDVPDAARDRRRLMPRLVNDVALLRLRHGIEADGRTLPALPAGVAGLSVVLVLDAASSVTYVTGELLRDLDLSLEAAAAIARANLGGTFAAELVRSAVGSPNLNVVKCSDTFDAARLLLVAGHLQPGESLAALVPDRDTLVLTAPPADGNWSALRALARATDGDPLCQDPLLVTPAGIERAS
jgi:hypothetical protein